MKCRHAPLGGATGPAASSALQAVGAVCPPEDPHPWGCSPATSDPGIAIAAQTPRGGLSSQHDKSMHHTWDLSSELQGSRTKVPLAPGPLPPAAVMGVVAPAITTPYRQRGKW